MLTSLTYCWYWLQHVGYCEHRQHGQSRAVLNMLKKSHRLTSSRGLHRQSNSRNRRTCSGFEVTLLVSFLITLLCHFSFNGLTKKKAEKEKPIDEDLADSTGLMEKLRKRRAGLRKVYGKTTCTILFVDLRSNMRSPCGYCDDGENI